MNRLDPLFEEAARLVIYHQRGSLQLIQRKFSIGYNHCGTHHGPGKSGHRRRWPTVAKARGVLYPMKMIYKNENEQPEGIKRAALTHKKILTGMKKIFLLWSC